MPTQSEIINANFTYLNDKVKEIELFKFPNAIITGNPTIESGQVSNFSNVDFLQFPFLVDLTNRRFRAEFCFTTGDDVTTQQNVLDSEFGLALAIKNGKGLMAIGHNGTSWAGQVVGSINIQPRTTYYANLTWSRINYQTQLSTNGTDYTPDMNFGSTQSPYPRTMFIGGSPDLFGPGTAHPFKGSINLNKCFLYIEEQLVWQGMDDAGLATRADISLDNLDAAGQAKFDAKQDKLIAGDNIIINDNVISSTGGSGAWKGTLAEYEALGTYDNNIQYNVTDDIGGKSIEPILEISGKYNIGQIVQSVLPLVDAGLHLLDGDIIDGNGIYSAFYDYMVGMYSQQPQCFTTESEWQQSVSTYGECGKFVLDSQNKTIRLPKLSGYVKSTTDITTIGDLVEAGLPNITGTSQFAATGSQYSGEGAFTKSVSGTAVAGSSIGTYWKPYLDASDSNSIYGNSDTVQPQSIKALLYICIATSVKTDIQVDLDKYVTDLNYKADSNLSNVAREYFKYPVPDFARQTIIATAGQAIGTYIAPTDGVIIGNLDGSAAQHITVNGFIGVYGGNDSGNEGPFYLPVCKDDVVVCSTTTRGASFVPYKFLSIDGVN